MANDVIESIAVIPEPTKNYDQLWMVVNRDNGRFVEFMEKNMITTVDANDDTVALREDQIRLDSCVTYNASATIFEGLDHLDGETVGILADGDVLDSEVVASGSITTSSAYTKVCVGKIYYSDLETLDVNFAMQNGSPMGVKLKVGNLMYRFVDSAGGYVGPDEDNLYEAITNQRVSHNASELLFTPEDYDWTAQSVSDPDPYLLTGDIRIPLGAGWSKGGRSFFQQRSPLPVTVSAVIPEISEHGGPV